ncbi:MAG: amino acid--tRNA ligase-related protein [Candidatus Roizmanbacteria bacterium]
MIKTSIQNRDSYIIYNQVVKSIESYLDQLHFLKLDLPVMLPELIPESYLEVFETEYRYIDSRKKLYLTPSPELLIKRLLVDGIGDCYYLDKSFRNSEPASSKHLGEFTMLELYKVGADYMDISEVVLGLLQNIKYKISNIKINHGSIDPVLRQAQHDSGDDKLGRDDKVYVNDLVITYQGIKVDLSRWEKMTVAEAFKKYAGITSSELFDHDLFRKAAKRKGYATEIKNEKLKIKNESESPILSSIIQDQKSHIDPVLRQAQHDSGDDKLGRDDGQGEVEYFTYEELWSQIYSNEVEPHLGKNGHPTLLYDYPVEFAALSKPNADGITAQRFEFYIAGVELGNCYSELTDWPLQEERLRKEQQERAKSGKISHPTDWGFIESLKKGLPDCSGIAIGVDRLAMIFADVDSIDKIKLVSFEM